jgi:flavin reductase (DIM6/NTAB) family NADH-FMN oxidoreductase RutF
MKSILRSIKPEEITDNTFKMIGSDWMLVTAGPPEAYNTMTASWGGLGVIWSKNVCFCVIRPTRHTYGFIEKADNFTLSFFEEKYRSALTLCGTKSGRDIDKAKATGLTPTPGTIPGTTYFAEARLIIECRKLYYQDIDPKHFLDPEIDENYPEKDYHRMYIGEILSCRARVMSDEF